MFDISLLQNIILEFTMPYALDIQNCTSPEHKGTYFIVVIKDIPAMIRFERIFVEQPTTPGVIFTPGRIENDRYGLISKTKVQIWFDKQTFDSPDSLDAILSKEEFYENSARIYINKFVSDYRHITLEFWMRPLTSTDILAYRFILFAPNQEAITVNKLINRHPVHFNGGEEFSLPPDQEAILRKSLLADSVNLFDDLCLSIIDNFDKESYNIALIQCAILFENFIYSTLKKHLSKTKLDKLKKKEACGCLVGISEICERGIKQEFGLDFGSTDEYIAFKENVLKLRNLIVHGELISELDKPDCSIAIESTHKAITYIKQSLIW